MLKPPTVNRAASMPCFVWALIEHYHAGVLQWFIDYTGLQWTTTWRWVRGQTTNYRPAHLRTLAERYGLDLPALLALVERDRVTRIYGRPVPTPDLSDIKRGPPFRQQQAEAVIRPGSARRRR